MLDWLGNHPAYVRTALLSLGLGAVAVAIVAAVLVLLPTDHFERASRASTAAGSPAWRIARNVCGWVLVALGLAMLVFPGPGGIVLVLGVVMSDFPGKQRLQRWVLSHRAVFRPVNWLRTRFGRPPLRSPKRGSGRSA